MHAESGIVHQDVDRTRRVFEPGRHPIDRGTVGEIGSQDLDGSAEGPQRARGGVESRLVSSDENEVVSTMCELAGEFGTDAGCAPGHERYSHAAYDTVLTGNFAHRSRLTPAPEAYVS
ncbi:hypothetical protein GCM10025867_02520 [Frondihabitans sucicola]|uniref:Uncharacterized protein n=1 Tax=Frondihabitans sucicola TaxID=1268041 RepID=A0ABM8GI12_9MICO|nr:hypothetical protein GCM10025867_02520 [Frondihabitans sucicola]